jgi:hypothetical protein
MVTWPLSRQNWASTWEAGTCNGEGPWNGALSQSGIVLTLMSFASSKTTATTVNSTVYRHHDAAARKKRSECIPSMSSIASIAADRIISARAAEIQDAAFSGPDASPHRARGASSRDVSGKLLERRIIADNRIGQAMPRIGRRSDEFGERKGSDGGRDRLHVTFPAFESKSAAKPARPPSASVATSLSLTDTWERCDSRCAAANRGGRPALNVADDGRSHALPAGQFCTLARRSRGPLATLHDLRMAPRRRCASDRAGRAPASGRRRWARKFSRGEGASIPDKTVAADVN